MPEDTENTHAGRVISTSKKGRFAQIVLHTFDSQGKKHSETHHCRVESANTFSYPLGEPNEFGDFKQWNVVRLRQA